MIHKANITCDLCHIILAESDDGLFQKKKMTVYKNWKTIVEKESGSCGYGVIEKDIEVHVLYCPC